LKISSLVSACARAAPKAKDSIKVAANELFTSIVKRDLFILAGIPRIAAIFMFTLPPLGFPGKSEPSTADAIDDPLTKFAREGARRMPVRVPIAEADAFVAMLKDLKLPDGRLMRHGHGPFRAIQTGGRACRGPSRQGARRARWAGEENPLYQLPKVVQGVTFQNGIEIIENTGSPRCPIDLVTRLSAQLVERGKHDINNHTVVSSPRIHQSSLTIIALHRPIKKEGWR
jgi:hypothetical protein